jgi:hypothetical protein
MPSPSTDNPCTCGRTYTHCRHCGKKEIYLYFKKIASEDLSKMLGRQVFVFRCTKCGETMNSESPCLAGKEFVFKINKVIPKQKDEIYISPDDKRPQFTLDPDSWEYYVAYAERRLYLANSLQFKGESGLNVGMQKEGWVIIPDDTEYVNGRRVYAPGEEPIEHAQTITNDIPPNVVNVEPDDFTLDDVIERMKKEQGG